MNFCNQLIHLCSLPLARRRLPIAGFFLLLVGLPFAAYCQKSYDVVVYGGTSGGFTAAIQAAKMGRLVALLEPTKHIGGNNVEGLGGTDIDNHAEFQNSAAVGGLALEFYRRVAKAYGREKAFEQSLRDSIKNTALWRFESSIAEKIILEWLKEYKIELFYDFRLSEAKGAVSKRGTRIIQIRMENGQLFKAKMFIDATIEGDLLAASHITTTVGREDNSTYGETLNGIRGVTHHAQFNVKVDPYRIVGDRNSGLIPTIQNDLLGTPGTGDKRLQAFCFRMCLTKDPLNKIVFVKPATYNRKQYEIYLRYLRAGGKLYKPRVSIPNGKTDLGAWHDLSHNLYGMNAGYPEANYAKRKIILDQHKDFTQGLFYFLSNDAEVGVLDAELQKEWASWGLAKDEFPDNGGWPRLFYVRDGRRMVSDYVISEQHVRKENPAQVEDPVGMAYWPTDVHSVRRIVKDGYAYNEGFVFGGDYWRPLPISYRALVPKSSECTNLLTPTCPSSSHIAYGAIRLEWTFMVLGQSTGAAAALAIEHNKGVQDVNYSTLKNRLLKDGQVLEI